MGNDERRFIMKNTPKFFPFDLSKLVLELINSDLILNVCKSEKTGKYAVSYLVQGLASGTIGSYDALEQAIAEQQKIAEKIKAGDYKLVLKELYKGSELRVGE